MPPTGPLTKEQIGTIRAWIDGGAEWPDDWPDGKSSGTGDATVMAIGDAIRNGDHPTICKIMQRNRGSFRRAETAAGRRCVYRGLWAASDVGTLLAKGTDPNVQNDDGATALMYAVDDLEKTRALLDRGAKPNVRSGEGQHRSDDRGERQNFVRCGEASAQSRCGCNAAGTARQNSLQEAVFAGDLPLIRLLLDHGADSKGLFLGSLRAVDCRGLHGPAASCGKTGRHRDGDVWAAMVGNSRLFNVLLERGVNPPPGRCTSWQCRRKRYRRMSLHS